MAEFNGEWYHSRDQSDWCGVIGPNWTGCKTDKGPGITSKVISTSDELEYTTGGKYDIFGTIVKSCQGSKKKERYLKVEIETIIP